MRITPLVLHAAARLPALTSLFSDPLAVSSMVVTTGQKVVLTTPSAHGYPVDSYQALSIVDADSPNPITAATQSGGDWVFTTLYPHDLTMRNGSVSNWNLFAKLGGFTSDVMSGLLQLVDVPSANSFRVKPSEYVETITLTGTEVLLERLENGIIGWHRMKAASTTTLEFDTPAEITRTYAVANPRVVTNIRVAGSLSLQVAMDQYVRGYTENGTTQDSQAINQAWLFICPPPSVALSKDRQAQGDGVAEITPTSEYRQLLLDGFHVYVFLPAEQSGGGVACSDLACGEVFSAILRTFHGLVLPRRELYQADTFVCLMVEHGQALGDYNKATYVHGYVFQAPAYLTQLDAIQAFEWSKINEATMTAASGLGPGSAGGAVDTSSGSVQPSGSVAFRGVELELRHDDAPQPLRATVPLI